jgi:hypothetical protein
MHKRVAVLSLIAVFAANAGALPGDWTGKFAPCDRHAELLKSGPMNIGVRFSTSNRTLAVEFARAMSFWATVLDMTWREENSRQCAIQIVDGLPGQSRSGSSANASFQGWIAFNPRASLACERTVFNGRMNWGTCWGCARANPSSVMYFLSLTVRRSSTAPILRPWRFITGCARVGVRWRLRL